VSVLVEAARARRRALLPPCARLRSREREGRSAGRRGPEATEPPPLSVAVAALLSPSAEASADEAAEEGGVLDAARRRLPPSRRRCRRALAELAALAVEAVSEGEAAMRLRRCPRRLRDTSRERRREASAAESVPVAPASLPPSDDGCSGPPRERCPSRPCDCDCWRPSPRAEPRVAAPKRRLSARESAAPPLRPDAVRLPWPTTAAAAAAAAPSAGASPSAAAWRCRSGCRPSRLSQL